MLAFKIAIFVIKTTGCPSVIATFSKTQQDFIALVFLFGLFYSNGKYQYFAFLVLVLSRFSNAKTWNLDLSLEQTRF